MLRAVLAAAPGSVVVAGEFNAARDQAHVRSLEPEGFLDVADRAGVGFRPTCASGEGRHPVVAIDHLVAGDRPQRAVSRQRSDVPGSDRLAVVAVHV